MATEVYKTLFFNWESINNAPLPEHRAAWTDSCSRVPQRQRASPAQTGRRTSAIPTPPESPEEGERKWEPEGTRPLYTVRSWSGSPRATEQHPRSCATAEAELWRAGPGSSLPHPTRIGRRMWKMSVEWTLAKQILRIYPNTFLRFATIKWSIRLWTCRNMFGHTGPRQCTKVWKFTVHL